MMSAELESKLNVQSESMVQSEKKISSLRSSLDEHRDLSNSLNSENVRYIP